MIKILLSKIKPYFTFKDVRRIFTLLKPFILKQKKAYIVLFLTLGVDTFLTIGFASFYGKITDSAIHGGFHQILSLLPFGCFLILFNILSKFSNNYFNTFATNGVKMDLKNYFLNHILRISPKTISNLRSGELLSHFSNDINGVDGILGSNIINLIKLPITYIVVFIYLFHINWTLCLVSVVIAPFASLFGAIFGFLLRRNGRMIYRLIGDINNLLNETFNGLSVIRTFTLEKLQFINYSNKNQDLFQLELKNAKLQGWYFTAGQLVGTITFIVSLSVGSIFVSKQLLTVGSLLTFVNLVNHLVYPLTGLASQWANCQKSLAALERIFAILDKPVELENLPSYSPGLVFNQSIRFQNVSFGYDDKKKVLENFHIDIPVGKITALVGPTGAGKSTLFNLLQGFYNPQKGQIRFDDKLIQEIPLEELRSSIAHVPQETFLFSGTIRENLMLARPDIKEKEMLEAAFSANIHDFIVTLPNGYDTEIGERGVKLSGGEKQRIAIARALLKNAPILLLDEATSAMDNETEYHVKEALEYLMKGRTTIIIAHRLSTIQNADQIMVMDKGKIIQSGRHEELINQNGLYRKLNETIFTRNPKQLTLASRL